MSGWLLLRAGRQPSTGMTRLWSWKLDTNRFASIQASILLGIPFSTSLGSDASPPPQESASLRSRIPRRSRDAARGHSRALMSYWASFAWVSSWFDMPSKLIKLGNVILVRGDMSGESKEV